MPCSVLVIDDSPFVFKAVKRALEPHGIQIVGHAKNGQQGIELVQELTPDVITLDITMPVMDGLQTADWLSKHRPGSRVIMMSAMGDDGLLETARQLGVDHFISKPFQGDDLLTAVRQLAAEGGNS